MRTQLNRKLEKKYNKKRYYRIMRALGLKAIFRKKRPHYMKTSEFHVAEKVMNRNFDAHSPHLKWCTDVTELKYGNGRKAYEKNPGVSRCLDNQPIERLWGTYKSKSYYLSKYDTYEDLLKDVNVYIRYYNNYRYSERLGGLSPNEYRRAV